MQAYNARPAFSRLGSRALRSGRQPSCGTRAFWQSGRNQQDDRSDSPASQGQPVVPRRVQSSTEAANDVQNVYRMSQMGSFRRTPGQPPVRGPPADRKSLPSGADMQTRPARSSPVDLRSLGSGAQGAERPVLRPRSSHPANRGQMASRGQRGAGRGGGRGRPRRFGDGVESGVPATRQQLDEDFEDGRGDKKSAEKAAEALMEELDKEALAEREKHIPFIPPQETLESLDAYLPRMPLSESGGTRLIANRLKNTTDPISIHPSTRIRDLATRLRSGGYVLFRDEEEKAAVMEEAQNIARKSAKLKGERLGQVVEPILPEFQPLGKSSRTALEGEVYEGKYTSPVESIQHGQLDKMIHLIRKNSSYTPKDEASILKLLSDRIQAPAAAPAEPAKKTRRKAKQAE